MIQDNTQFLLDEIENSAKEKMDILRKDYEESLSEIKSDYKKTKQSELNRLEKSLEAQRQAFVFQRERMQDLKTEHIKIKEISKLVEEIKADVLKELLKPKTIKKLIPYKILEAPVKITGAKLRNDTKVIAFDKQELEFDMLDFIDTGRLYELVVERL